jgi:glycosyltransferase involved in cell wall biosynthesis
MTNEVPLLSVVIPAHNEATHIEKNLLHVLNYLHSKKRAFEVVVVNDGSSDNTFDIVETLARSHPELVVVSYLKNAGKGNALQKGIAASKGRFVLIADADLELPIEQTELFMRVQHETGSQVVIGSKWHPDSKLDYPSGRKVLSRCLHLLIRVLFSLGVTDTQVGIKLFDGPSIRFVNQTTLVKRFAWDIELLLVARLYGLKIAEAPVVLQFTRVGLGRIKVKTIIQVAREVAGIWFRHHVEHYYVRALEVRNTPMLATKLNVD